MNKLVAFFLVALCFFATLIPSVRAHDGEEWDDENDRSLSYENNGDSVEIESDDDTLGNELKFHAEVDSDGLFVELEYKSHTNSTESEIKFRTVVSFLYEYQETNNKDGYQEGEDTLVTKWDLGNINWSSFSCSTSGSSPTVYSCDVESTVVGATIHVSDGVSAVSGVPLKPSGAKIDLYLEKSSVNPIAVAIGFRSETDEDFEVESESDEEAEGFTSASEKQVSIGTDAFFSWVETATLGSETINVINSGLIDGSDLDDASGQYDYVMFSFVTTSSGQIVWDPKASVGSTISSASGLVPSTMLLFAVLAAMLY